MSGLLASLEGSGLAAWVRGSQSVWAYPTILTLHTLGLAILVGAACVANFRLLGMAPQLPLPQLRPLFPIMWGAFAVNAATGAVLFAADATHRAGQRVFQVKLTLVIGACITTFALQKCLAHASGSTRSRTRLACLSLLLWAGAIIAGRLMAYL